MRRLFCVFVVRIGQQQVFAWRDSFNIWCFLPLFKIVHEWLCNYCERRRGNVCFRLIENIVKENVEIAIFVLIIERWFLIGSILSWKENLFAIQLVNNYFLGIIYFECIHKRDDFCYKRLFFERFSKVVKNCSSCWYGSECVDRDFYYISITILFWYSAKRKKAEQLTEH